MAATPASIDRATTVGALFLAHRGSLLGYLHRLMGDRHRGEDVVQETMLRAFVNADRLWPDESARRAWLIRVAHNIAVSDLGRPEAQVMEIDETTTPLVASDPADHISQHVDMARALRRLSAGQRRVVFEIFYRGRTAAEAADAIGISPGTAKEHLRVGLHRLRRNLDGVPLQRGT